MYKCTGDSFSYMKLLLIIKCVQNDRFCKNWIKIAWDLKIFVLNINLRHVKVGWYYFCVQISTLKIALFCALKALLFNAVV